MILRYIPAVAIGIAGAVAYFSNKSKQSDTSLPEHLFPFGMSELNGQYSIRVPLSDRDLYRDYFDLFGSFGFSGDGKCWEAHIIQILEKRAPDLLDHIEFDAEIDSFYAYASSREHQVQFMNILTPIFQNLSALTQYIKHADRSRVYH